MTFNVTEVDVLDARVGADGAAYTSYTLTVQLAVLSPSVVLTVIVASPAPSAVTFPVVLTVATLAAFVDHDTVLSVAFDGNTVAISVSVAPLSSVSVFLLSDTPITTILSVVILVPVLAALSL